MQYSKAKFGAEVMVARNLVIVSNHSAGRWMKCIGANP